MPETHPHQKNQTVAETHQAEMSLNVSKQTRNYHLKLLPAKQNLLQAGTDSVTA